MQTDAGDTPLHFAAFTGRSKVVKMLLQTKQGYDALTIKSHFGSTPLDLATKQKETETIALLKEAMNSRKL